MKAIKILQFNVWNGRIKDGLSRFISEGNYDVVCMQEAMWGSEDGGFLKQYVDTVDKIMEIGGFDYSLRSSCYGISLLNGEAQAEYGNAIISKIPFSVTEEKVLLGNYQIMNSIANFSEANVNRAFNIQKVVLENGLTIFNHHAPFNKDPLGNERDMECMRQIADYTRGQEKMILCGDLNMKAEAPAMRNVDFLRDLTAIHNIKSTLMPARYTFDVPCDHILISDDINYQNFQALDTIASDHKALSVEVLAD